MNQFKFLFKLQGSKYVRQGDGITSGNFAVRTPGIYRYNWKTNGWWGTPSDPIEITEDEIETALKNHEYGVLV